MTQEKEMSRVVRAISLDKRYRGEPFPAIPAEALSIGTFVTGQHVDPENEDTFDGLSVEEMTKKEKITPKARKDKYSYIIDPSDHILLAHGRRFNLTMKKNKQPLNPKDYWEYQFFMLVLTYAGDALVAKNKKSYVPSKNFFYIEDKEAEAVQYISEEEVYIKAINYVMGDVASQNYFELALLLNYKVPGFHIDPAVLSANQLKEALYAICKKDPLEVLKCNPDENPEVKKESFFLKLVKFDIIAHKLGEGFFDNDKFLGRNLNDMLDMADKKDNVGLVDKWGRLLMSKQEGYEVPYKLIEEPKDD